MYGVYTVQCVQCRMEVDEVCTGSPVSMDGVVMDSVTSASYSPLYCTPYSVRFASECALTRLYHSCLFHVTLGREYQCLLYVLCIYLVFNTIP